MPSSVAPAPIQHRLLDGPVARRLAARRFGQGEETLVLCHGFGTDQHAWNRLLPSLADGRSVISFNLAYVDAAGFDGAGYPGLAGYADDLTALMAEQGVRGAVFLGHSVGGMVGALASIAAPSWVSRLIMLNPSPRYLNDEDYDGGFTQSDLDALFAAMRDHYQAWVAGFAPAAIGENAPAATREFARGLLTLRPDIALGVARVIFESDLRNILPAIAVPTTVIHTRADIAVPAAVADFLLTHIPDAQAIRIEAEGHLPHLSSPEQVLEALTPILGLR